MTPAMRRRLVSEWEGGDFSGWEPVEPRDLREAVRNALRRVGLAERFQEAHLTEAWGELVGPALAPHCQPAGVRRGILTVKVDHPTWMHQIAFLHKARMLQSIQRQFPQLQIRDLILRSR